MIRHLPNAITSLNLLTGAIGCIAILQGNPDVAIYFVIVSAIFDFFDGLTARLLHVKSPMGKELDSLADMVSFGMVPAFYLVEKMGVLTNEHPYLKYLGLLVGVFSALRLAKFNLDTRQTDQFIGLPTPANALMITSLSMVSADLQPSLLFWVGLSIVSSFLLIAELPLIALKFKGISWNHNRWRYLILITSAIILLVFGLDGAPAVIPAYLLISIAGNLSTKSHV